MPPSGTEGKTSFWLVHKPKLTHDKQKIVDKLINAFENVLRAKTKTQTEPVAILNGRNMCKKTTAELILVLFQTHYTYLDCLLLNI